MKRYTFVLMGSRHKLSTAGLLLFAALFAGTLAGCGTTQEDVSTVPIGPVVGNIAILPVNGSTDESPSPMYEAILGVTGRPIALKNIRIILTAGAFNRAIADNTDVSSWITNLPKGLRAEIHGVNAGDKGAFVRVSGTTNTIIREPVKVTIPASVLGTAHSLVIPQNPFALFDIQGATVAGASTIVIGGPINTAIKRKDIRIDITAARIATDIPAGTNLSAFVPNLPTGLKVTTPFNVHQGADSLTLRFTGTPTVMSHEPVFLILPASYIGGRNDLRVNTIKTVFTAGNQSQWGSTAAGRSEERVLILFDIGENDYNTISNDYTSRHSNRYWFTDGWTNNNPQIPALSNWEPLGIVQLTTQTTETLGDDGNYHWGGENITYSNLMKAALDKYPNAQGIVNVIINAEDHVVWATKTWDVEEGHIETPAEIQKEKSGVLTFRKAGGQVQAIELSRITTRKNTATALAIRYVPLPASSLAAPPVSATKNTDGSDNKNMTGVDPNAWKAPAERMHDSEAKEAGAVAQGVGTAIGGIAQGIGAAAGGSSN